MKSKFKKAEMYFLANTTQIVIIVLKDVLYKFCFIWMCSFC